MTIKLVVAIIHGMGDIKADFADRFIHDVCDRINNDSITDQIKFVPIHWSDITQPRQVQYFSDAQNAADLHYTPVRRFIISALGDAAAYQRVPGQPDSTYQQIHNVIDQALDLEVDDDTPLVVVAHSLGGHIMSNYIWDKQSAPDDSASAYRNFQTHVGMFTLGCNIPLFSFASESPQPIQFPGIALNESARTKAKWLNYFDKDDVLGYPLKVINSAYDAVVDQDIEVNIGNIFQQWNPFSHDVYWHDRDVTKPIAKFITGLFDD